MSAGIERLPSGHPSTTGAAIVTTIVREDSTGDLLIDTESGLRPARRARGCLLRPRAGDLVLAALTARQAYILTVLEAAPGRDGNERTHLDLPPDTILHSGAQGGLTVEADRLHLQARNTLLESSDELALKGGRLQLGFGEIRALARRLRATLEESRCISGVHDLIVRTCRFFARHSERHVETLDATQAGNIHVKAEQVLRMKGETVLAKAGKLYRVDGKQIHLG